jgi:sugar/nucleoside kinase (ribokinase family)
MASYFLHRGLAPQMVELFRRIKSAGLSVSLDTNDDPEGKWESNLQNVLPFVDILMLNEREIKSASHNHDLNVAIEHFAEIVPIVVVKLGRNGVIARRGKEKFVVPAMPVDAIDSIGAGDSFDAGFIHHYLRGDDLVRCLESGNLAGAYSLTRPGGTEAFRDKRTMEEFFRAHRRWQE